MEAALSGCVWGGGAGKIKPTLLLTPETLAV